MKATNGNQLKCPKCRGHLARGIEYTEIRKLDVIKCVICGHRVAEREVLEGMDRTPKKPQPEAPCMAPVPVPVKPKFKKFVRKRRPLPPVKSGKTGKPCACCGREGLKLVARKLCGSCYTHNADAGTLERYPRGYAGTSKKPKGDLGTPPCLDCGRPGLAQPSRGLCFSCWEKNRDAGTLDKFPAKRQKDPNRVALDFSQAGRADLLAAIQQQAKRHGRSPAAQILHLLEQATA